MTADRLISLFKGKKTIFLINSILGFLLIAALLLLIRHFLAISLTTARETPPQEKKIQAGKKFALHDYENILRNNPFGFPAGELKPLSPASGNVAAVQSDVKLIGTVAGNRKLSYAIFVDKSGRQDVFRAGDQVYGLGVLAKVGTDRVVIDANGKEIEIDLADITAVMDATKPATAPPNSFGRKIGESSFVIDQQKVQDAIEKPDQLMTDARFVPYIAAGEQKGFLLREVKFGGIYHSLGLQNGDVLLRINEYDISSPENALQAFTALRGINRAQLDILRHGSRMTMTYQIR
jgi:general secretion pathway protein C